MISRTTERRDPARGSTRVDAPLIRRTAPEVRTSTNPTPAGNPATAEPGAQPSVLDALKVGGAWFVILGFIGRMPVATLQLVMLLAGSRALGNFAAGGLLVAAVGVGGAFGGVAIGWCSDRFGQRGTGLVGTAVQVLALAVLTRWGLAPGAPLAMALALAVLVGAANPQVGAMARSRWNALARSDRNPRGLVGAAMGYEGAADEASFVLGPILASLLVGALPIPTVMTVMMVWLALAQAAFMLHPGALKPLPRNGSEASTGQLPIARVVPLVVAVTCVGLVFGSTQTGVAALLEDSGRTALTGFVYGALGVGSGLASLALTRLPVRRLTLRIAGSGALLGLAGIGLIATTASGPLALACFVVGVFVAPVLTGSYSLMGALAPSRLITTAMTLLAVATTVGVSLGAAVAGSLVEAAGPRTALLLPTVAGVIVLAAALVAAKQHGELRR